MRATDFEVGDRVLHIGSMRHGEVVEVGAVQLEGCGPETYVKVRWDMDTFLNRELDQEFCPLERLVVGKDDSSEKDVCDFTEGSWDD